ncbi:hypothetical protein [Natronoglomus mannanivorans]|uniref:Adaptin domain-containing protein n=1 Tax=Natronoglomus mannanivorans TaxID=2979990 RepID=A0AAP3E1B1_9EURY|nr:adaptin domain-containing protein [Halobacteria archaeon AArc-xg1-1]
MTTDDQIATARSFLQDVQAVPTAADVATLHELLEDDDPSARRISLDALRVVASRDPPLFRAEFVGDLERLHSLCSDTDATVRTAGADLLTTLAADPAGEPPDGTFDPVPSLLEDDSRLVKRQTLKGLQQIGSAAPERVRPFAGDVIGFLEDDDPTITKHAVVVLAQVASVDGSSVADAAPTLFELFQPEDGDGEPEIETPRTSDVRQSTDIRERFESVDHDQLSRRRLVRRYSGHAISRLAVADPDAVTSMIEPLSTLLSDADPQIRAVAAETVLALAESRPQVVFPYRTTLADRLEAEATETVRGRLAQTLAALGVDEPDVVGACVVDRTDPLRPLLDHDEPPVRGAAANLLALAASAADSSAETDATGFDIVSPVEDRLEALLEDDVEYVRAAATDALESGLGAGESEGRDQDPEQESS